MNVSWPKGCVQHWQGLPTVCIAYIFCDYGSGHVLHYKTDFNSQPMLNMWYSSCSHPCVTNHKHSCLLVNICNLLYSRCKLFCASATCHRDGQMVSMQVSYETMWADRYYTCLLIELMPTGVVSSLLVFSFVSFLFQDRTHLQGCILLQQHLDLPW